MKTVIKWFAAIAVCVWGVGFLAMICVGFFHLITPESYHFLPNDQIKQFVPFLSLSIFVFGLLFFIYWCERDLEH